MTYWVAGAMVVGAIGGGVISSSGAKSAANTQAGAATNAANLGAREFNTITQQEQPFMQSGYGAMSQLDYLLGISPGSSSGGGGTLSGGPMGGFGAPQSQVQPDTNFFNKGSGALFNPWTVTSRLGGAGQILDPAGGIFGNLLGGGQSSNKRNFNAFNEQFPGTSVTANGDYKLPNGSIVNQKQLDDLTGTWYGATYHPDGDQQGWQQKLQDLQKTGVYGNSAQGGGNADPSSGWTMSPDGTMSQRLTAGQGMTPTGQPMGQPGQPAQGSTAGGFGSLLKPFGLSDFYNYSPAYQFQQQQGMQGVLNANAAGAGALSGAAQKDLIDYNQGLAGTSFNNAFNQYQTQQGNIFNRLSGIAQLGQSAAANTGQQGTALTGQIGQSITNAGTAAAAGQVGSANAWSGALSSAAPWLSQFGGGGSSASNPSSSYNWDFPHA